MPSSFTATGGWLAGVVVVVVVVGAGSARVVVVVVVSPGLAGTVVVVDAVPPDDGAAVVVGDPVVAPRRAVVVGPPGGAVGDPLSLAPLDAVVVVDELSPVRAAPAAVEDRAGVAPGGAGATCADGGFDDALAGSTESGAIWLPTTAANAIDAAATALVAELAVPVSAVAASRAPGMLVNQASAPAAM